MGICPLPAVADDAADGRVMFLVHCATASQGYEMGSIELLLGASCCIGCTQSCHKFVETSRILSCLAWKRHRGGSVETTNYNRLLHAEVRPAWRDLWKCSGGQDAAFDSTCALYYVTSAGTHELKYHIERAGRWM